jgi:hypothetical protein
MDHSKPKKLLVKKMLQSFTKPIKTITQRNPNFLKQAYKYGHLIDLQNDERFISPSEKFIVYYPQEDVWTVYKMTKDRKRSLGGRFKHVIDAVFHAYGGKIK